MLILHPTMVRNPARIHCSWDPFIQKIGFRRSIWQLSLVFHLSFTREPVYCLLERKVRQPLLCTGIKSCSSLFRPESNIKPWATLIGEMDEGNKRIPWESRDPHAFWKGNAVVVPTRRDLMKCNATKEHDWNALLYAQDWAKEAERGFNTSDLASQCTHRFKIYIEGRGWSVSEKYILACDSPTLLVDTRFIDFFTRGLMPGRHYLPIPDDDKCRSIKAAVDWGNAHPDEAQAIGRAGSRYILDELDMDHVYDYMLHLLTEYSKLLRFRPAVPENATLLCLEYFACQAEGRAREYMVESMVTAPRDSEPCAMPPPFGPGELEGLLEMKAKATAQAEKWK